MYQKIDVFTLYNTSRSVVKKYLTLNFRSSCENINFIRETGLNNSQFIKLVEDDDLDHSDVLRYFVIGSVKDYSFSSLISRLEKLPTLGLVGDQWVVGSTPAGFTLHTNIVNC
ncbi:hypothetical protein RF11_14722 [Thelohanellus kitauei]|uniref:Uncharacterized protein n=1 Tax=Thelohanellus kitauei TaxID=669202 RepID=A0A0C2MGI0_THEKT|nr:hypothetical protein RF11_14722 [Thelohanellus kitauei]